MKGLNRYGCVEMGLAVKHTKCNYYCVDLSLIVSLPHTGILSVLLYSKYRNLYLSFFLT